LFAFGNGLFSQFEGFLQVIGLVQRLGEQGVAEVGEVGFFRAAKDTRSAREAVMIRVRSSLSAGMKPPE
jgi:hypothetical protein